MPVWEALYVTILATRTGWTEHFIRHELPLSRGHAYYHACRLLDGERCRWPRRESAMAKHVSRVFDWIQKKLKTTRHS